MTDTRLTLAAQILSGILANPNRQQTTDMAIDMAIKYAEKLIERAKEKHHDTN